MGVVSKTNHCMNSLSTDRMPMWYFSPKETLLELPMLSWMIVAPYTTIVQMNVHLANTGSGGRVFLMTNKILAKYSVFRHDQDIE